MVNPKEPVAILSRVTKFRRRESSALGFPWFTSLATALYGLLLQIVPPLLAYPPLAVFAPRVVSPKATAIPASIPVVAFCGILNCVKHLSYLYLSLRTVGVEQAAYSCLLLPAWTLIPQCVNKKKGQPEG